MLVQVELKTGESFRGELHDAEDNWNVQLSNVTATARDGKVSHMEHIFIRGSQIRFLIIPDMLKNAPMVSLCGRAANRVVRAGFCCENTAAMSQLERYPSLVQFKRIDPKNKMKNVALGVGGRGRGGRP